MLAPACGQISPPRHVLGAWLGLFILACGGDGGESGPGGQGPLRLVAVPPALMLHPGGAADLEVSVLDQRDQPVSGHTVEIALAADGDAGSAATLAAGATLSRSQDATDGRGKVSLRVRAGLVTTFAVRVRASRAAALDVGVVVVPGTRADVEVAPRVASVGPTVSGFNLRLYDNQRCANLPLSAPTTLPPPVRPARDVAPATGAFLFTGLEKSADHAAVALGLDTAGVIQYVGCVDIPGPSLPEQHRTRVLLPLFALTPDLTGTYATSSELLLDPRPRGANVLVEAWKRLSACPLDPAAFMLDCTVDALSETSDADPLDCTPAADLAAEGPLAARIRERRGQIAMAPLPGVALCASETDGAGRASLERLLRTGFGTPAPRLLTDLPALADDIVALVTRVRLFSQLVVTGPFGAGAYRVEHSLERLEGITRQGIAPVKMSDLAVDSPRARFVPASHAAGKLKIESHAFTLRLGRGLREAFARRALAARMHPGTIAALVGQLYGHLGAPSGETGCLALDRLTCESIGEAAGCVVQACERGQAALTAELERGFGLLDGDALDLVLAGNAPTIDVNGDQRIDQLGQLVNSSIGPGLWSAELRTRGGESAFSGFFVGNLGPVSASPP